MLTGYGALKARYNFISECSPAPRLLRLSATSYFPTRGIDLSLPQKHHEREILLANDAATVSSIMKRT